MHRHYRFVREALFATAVGVGALAGTPVALAADVTIRIGWATTDTETDAYRFAAHQFAGALQKAAPGRFQVNFFPNRQLGDEKELLQGMQLGTVDAALVTNTVVSNVEPAFLINDLPFLYANAEQAHSILDGPLGKDLADRLVKKNVITIGFCESGFRNMVNNVRPVTEPKDVTGVKYRVMESPIFIGMYRSLGGTSVPMAWGDTFTALQQGTIDGLEVPTWAIAAAKFNEIAKYLSVTQHVYTATLLGMSSRAYGRLSEADKKRVMDAGQIACVEQRKFNAAQEEKNLADLKAKGMTINTTKDPAAFRDKMRPVYDEYRPRIGADLMDRWLAAVAK
jgi:tripartite ATP-independent transporter DctP family solute receptor